MGYPVALVCSGVPCPCAGQNPGLALNNHGGDMAILEGEVLHGKAWFVGKASWPSVGV